MSNVAEWNVAASSNNSAAPDGAPEDMAPSGVNDTMREMMAAVSRWYKDANGSLTSAGSANAYALTTNNSHAALADQSILVFRANHANTGAATLNVDSLGAKAIRFNDAALVSGQIVADIVYVVVYNATDDAYDLIGASNSASSLTIGTLPDARLSSNVPLKNAENTFAADQTITGDLSLVGTGVLTVAGDSGPTGSGISLGNNTSDTYTWMQSFNSRPIKINPLGNDVKFGTSEVSWTDFARLSQPNTFDGAVTTPNISASEIGYKGAPHRDVTASTNTAASDSGGTVKFTAGTGQTFTLDSDPSTDSVIVLVNKSGASWTIAASVSLTWAATGGTGNRTLANGGMAVAYHDGAGNWFINGGGLS